MDISDFLEQKWRNSTFKDNFIFNKTLELFPNLCKKILELILQVNIKNIEMQVADSDNISKRMRYYQGLIDGDKLKHGKHYSALGDISSLFVLSTDLSAGVIFILLGNVVTKICL